MDSNQELTYTSPTLLQTFASMGLDFFLVLVIGFVLLLGSIKIMNSTQSYQFETSKRESLQLESNLYVYNDGIYSLNDYLAEKQFTLNEQSDFYELRLSYFYDHFLPSHSSIDGTTIYKDDKNNAKVDSSVLFNEKGERIILSSDYDKDYLSFYKDEYQNKALGYLSYCPEYKECSRNILWMQIGWGIASFSLSFFIFDLAIPLCLSKGKKTIGMLLCHVANVGNDGISIPFCKQILLSLFRYFLIYIGSVVALFIPLAISIGMIILRPSRQSLGHYVLGCFYVDDRNSTIYRNHLEAVHSLAKKG